MSLGIYQYHNIFYTGTAVQPDALQIFIKPDKGVKGSLAVNALPIANWIGFCCPGISLVSGAIRVCNAVQKIFKEIPRLREGDEHRAELWNAFKNLFRGFVEMVPFTGITLVLFDAIRNSVRLKKILKELKEEENIAGVAMDGKILFTIDLEKVDRISPGNINSNQLRLKTFQYLCLQMLKRSEKSEVKVGMNELFPRLVEVL